jgi:ferredoxin
VNTTSAGSVWQLPKSGLDVLLTSLWRRGYRVLGPVVRGGGVVFDEVHLTSDMPVSLRDEQQPGHYRLVPGPAGEVFGIVNGPGSLKPSFFAPEEALVEVKRQKPSFTVTEVEPRTPRVAVVGVRACDLAALAIQDRVFLGGRLPDGHYEARRRRALIIAVDCTRSASSCFCTSMETGPGATQGYDLAMTETVDGFLIRSGSDAGESLLAELDMTRAEPEAVDAARARVDACASGMTRRLDTADLPRLLYDQAEHPRWEEVAQRCLSCTNCTMVCPTCFCHTVVDVEEIDGNMSRRVRRWDSCFSLEHARIHSINFRPKTAHRYRQWLTHKLASWIDQFGTSGCVGCGRCITWCPVGIDLTEEVAAIRATHSHQSGG